MIAEGSARTGFVWGEGGAYAVAAGRQHHHLELALHLPDHELLVKAVGTSQHQQAGALINGGRRDETYVTKGWSRGEGDTWAGCYKNTWEEGLELAP